MSVVAENTLKFISELNPTKLSIADQTLNLAHRTLEKTPLPTTRVEAWKYTRVAKIGKTNFVNSKAEIDSLEDFTVVDAANTFVFVNGHFSEALSSKDLPTGVQVKPLSQNGTLDSKLPLEGEVFSALNLAYLNDGIHIEIAKNAVVEAPIQVIHILSGENQLSNFKMNVVAGDFSKASVVQGFFCHEANNSFANCTSEITVGANSHLTIEKIQNETADNFHIGTDHVMQGKDSTFTINTMTLNGGFVRNNLNISVDGENCTTNLNGAYLLKEKQHVDNHTIVDHTVANCNSNELYKGVVDENATAIFNGKVFVRKDAQKINAFQSNRNVLLSDNSTVNSKPELEIYADDVKCSHGSTTGQLDDEAIYYLQARGLSKRAATQLLVSAFITEVIDHVQNESVKTFIYDRLNERFGWDINPEDFG